jgi:signal transduction histidine kinase
LRLFWDTKLMKILLADDSEPVLRLLTKILQAEGHEILCAGDGEQALEFMEKQPVDAVISDILMPRMDGYRLCLELRRREKFQKLPFVFYSSNFTNQSDEKTAMDLGADFFLAKPAPVAKVLEALATAVARAPQRRSPTMETEAHQADSLKDYSERLVAKLEEKNAELLDQAEALRKQEAELRQSHQQLRVLAQRLQAAREEERLRIARELHDGMGGLLVGIEMGLTWMHSHLESKDGQIDRERLLKKSIELDKLARDSADRVRQLCTELRPPILDDLGLGAAMAWQTKEFEKRSAIRCALAIDEEIAGFSSEQVTAIFRIFQEILTNIGRHSQASAAKGRVHQSASGLVMEINDNGVGIRPEQVSGARSLGLLGMQERVGFLGGTIAFRGKKGEGTTVQVTIPLAPAP